MSATFVPGFNEDIFISYCHIDDVDPLNSKGWVTRFVEILESRLSKKLGTRDFRLWMDFLLLPYQPLSNQIMERIQSTAILIVILSPSYLNSIWCKRERNAFLDFVQHQSFSDSRLFVVEHDRVKRESCPEEFRKLLGYRFWKEEKTGSTTVLGELLPNIIERDYFARMGSLVEGLASRLTSLRNEMADEELQVQTTTSGPSILLAEVTDDLFAEREQVKLYLEQKGIIVLPDRLYPNDPFELKQAIETDLQISELFVQLLSDFTGKRRPDLPSPVQVQHECARNAGIRTLQWRAPELSFEQSEEEHRRLLEGETVLAVKLGTFKREIIKALQPKTADRKAISKSDKLLFLNAYTEDKPLATKVAHMMTDMGIGHVLSPLSADTTDYREDLEQCLLTCDGVIVFYGMAQAKWAKHQLLYCHKVLGRREHPYTIMALYEGPPEIKESLDIHLPGLLTINCRRGPCVGELHNVLLNLSTGGSL